MTTLPNSQIPDRGLLSQFLDLQIDSTVDGYLRNLAIQTQHEQLNAHKLDTLLDAVQAITQRMDALNKKMEVLRAVSKAAPAAPATPAAVSVKRGPQPGDILCAGTGYPELVLLPSGSFRMGSIESSDEQPVHTVNIASFAIGKYPVTQAQWRKVMGNNPSHFRGDDLRPVERVSWDDAQAFIQKLNQLTGESYRLPSEAEWEYACRAGSTGKWCCGNNETQIREYAWCEENSDSQTQPVGRKKPNAFGLFDMHGNVLEWCEDRSHANYKSALDDGRAWVSGDTGRVMRGGCFALLAEHSRAAIRYDHSPGFRSHFIGFRVARTAP